mmetsp:Transcript_134631/g.319123  ORF Transcript_134631/g.319123 Transcript_134631/m.319123 type:complete len:352 (+) Transcript_134631:1210-2265(+)
MDVVVDFVHHVCDRSLRKPRDVEDLHTSGLHKVGEALRQLGGTRRAGEEELLAAMIHIPSARTNPGDLQFKEDLRHVLKEKRHRHVALISRGRLRIHWLGHLQPATRELAAPRLLHVGHRVALCFPALLIHGEELLIPVDLHSFSQVVQRHVDVPKGQVQLGHVNREAIRALEAGLEFGGGARNHADGAHGGGFVVAGTPAKSTIGAGIARLVFSGHNLHDHVHALAIYLQDVLEAQVRSSDGIWPLAHEVVVDHSAQVQHLVASGVAARIRDEGLLEFRGPFFRAGAMHLVHGIRRGIELLTVGDCGDFVGLHVAAFHPIVAVEELDHQILRGHEVAGDRVHQLEVKDHF